MGDQAGKLEGGQCRGGGLGGGKSGQVESCKLSDTESFLIPASGQHHRGGILASSIICSSTEQQRQGDHPVGFRNLSSDSWIYPGCMWRRRRRRGGRLTDSRSTEGLKRKEDGETDML